MKKKVVVIIIIVILILLLLSQCTNTIRGIVMDKGYEPGRFKRSPKSIGKMIVSTKVYDDPDWVITVTENSTNGREKRYRIEIDSIVYARIKIKDSIIIENNVIIKHW